MDIYYNYLFTFVINYKNNLQTTFFEMEKNKLILNKKVHKYIEDSDEGIRMNNEKIFNTKI